MISRVAHAWLDYLSALVLIFAPWALKFSDSDEATAVSVGSGFVVLLLSIATKYEGGLYRRISMSMHLNLDVFLGIFLVASPWLFAFKDKVFVPHLVIGTVAVLAGLFTKRQSTSKQSSWQ
ncbi:SPW repeat domain-containing protein [Pedobacter sp.]